jgi:hypothetical protein
MSTIVLNDKIFQAIDSIYTESHVSYLTTCEALHGNPYNIRIKKFGDVIATLYPEDPHFNHVFNLSTESIECLPRINSFYKRHKANYWITLNPRDFSDKVSKYLIKHGLQPAGYHTKFIRRPARTRLTSTPRIKVNRVNANNLESVVETSLEGFGAPKKAWKRLKPRMRLLLDLPNTHWFYATFKGDPAATGILYKKGQFALLSGAETRPAFRGRGCHNIFTNTYSFQAPEFYSKFGYESMGVVSGFPDRVTKHFFKKKLR